MPEATNAQRSLPNSGSQNRQRVRSLQITRTPEEFAVVQERATDAGISMSSCAIPEEISAQRLSPNSGSQKRQRVKSLQIALTLEEFMVVRERAADAGLSLSSYGRAALLGGPGPRARRSPPLNAELLAHAVAQLNKAGSNLNQIARILNAGRAVGSKEAVEALADTRSAVVRILDIVGRRERS
jgi:hypothetical protein